jgi:hypothetical protein
MSLLSPASLAWLALLAPLIALYILRRRREARVVGSTMLWDRAVRDMRAERPWQRLIPYVSLILQALVLVLGALALARPSGVGEVPSGARIAVVVDASASMATRDPGGRTRMDAARAVVSSLADALPPGGLLTIVEAASEPAVLLAPTADGAEITRAIGQLRVRGAEAALDRAVAVAAERVRDAPPGSRVVVITDAASDGETSLAATVPVEVQRVGMDAVNDAIVAVDVRARPSEESPDRAEIFVRVARHAVTPASRWVTASIDGRGVVASRRVELAPGEPESVLMLADLPPDADGRAALVRVELSEGDPAAGAIASSGEDALSLDDAVVAPSPGARRLPVFLVGSAPASVRRVLLADRDVELFQTTLASLQERAADAERTELDGVHVFAGETPASPPDGDALVVAPTGERAFSVTLGPEVRSPRVVSWEEDDPRLRFVSFGDVHVAAMRPITGGAARTLVQTDHGALAASLAHPGGEVTLLGFDPDRSDLPDQPGFVILFRNVLERARQRRAEGGIRAGRIGEPLRVPAPDGATVEVRCPDGSTARGLSRGGVAIVEVPAVPGVFEATVGRRRLFALRNLLSPSESDPRPRARFVTREGGAEVEVSEAAAPREAWAWLAGALLVILLLEAAWASRKGAT